MACLLDRVQRLRVAEGSLSAQPEVRMRTRHRYRYRYRHGHIDIDTDSHRHRHGYRYRYRHRYIRCRYRCRYRCRGRCIDIDRYFDCLKEASKSVQVLFHGAELLLVQTFMVLKQRAL